MKKIKLIALVLLAMLAIQSCKKPGLGGDATVVAFPKHHGKAIYGATVFVKFDTQDSPGSSTSSYDATFEGKADEDNVKISGLKQGKYYLYAIGYDSSISAPVYGGQSINIKRKDRKDEQNLDIAVTE